MYFYQLIFNNLYIPINSCQISRIGSEEMWGCNCPVSISASVGYRHRHASVFVYLCICVFGCYHCDDIVWSFQDIWSHNVNLNGKTTNLFYRVNTIMNCGWRWIHNQVLFKRKQHSALFVWNDDQDKTRKDEGTNPSSPLLILCTKVQPSLSPSMIWNSSPSTMLNKDLIKTNFHFCHFSHSFSDVLRFLR